MKNITENRIDINAELAAAHQRSSGAVVLFSGDVRDLNKGKEVDHLFYEAYQELAQIQIEAIIHDAKCEFDLHYARCIHRTGKLDIMETAVVVLTSSMHRKEAYKANQYIIDRVKREASIWKKEIYKDGSFIWGNNCNCASHSPKEVTIKSLLL